MTTDSSSRDRRSQTDARRIFGNALTDGRGSQRREGGILPKGAENATNGFPWPLAAGGRARAASGRQSVRAEMDSVPTPRGKSTSTRSGRGEISEFVTCFLGGERVGSGQGTTAYSNLNFPRRPRGAGWNGAPATELEGRDREVGWGPKARRRLDETVKYPFALCGTQPSKLPKNACDHQRDKNHQNLFQA